MTPRGTFGDQGVGLRPSACGTGVPLGVGLRPPSGIGLPQCWAAGLGPPIVALRAPRAGSPVSPPPTGAGGAIPVPIPVAPSPAAPGTGRVSRALAGATGPPRGVGDTGGG